MDMSNEPYSLQAKNCGIKMFTQQGEAQELIVCYLTTIKNNLPINKLCVLSTRIPWIWMNVKSSKCVMTFFYSCAIFFKKLIVTLQRVQLGMALTPSGQLTI